MIKPIKAYSLTFISDGTSTSASFDLAKLPVREDFNGSLPSEVLNPAITQLGIVTFTTALVGTTVTFTFSDVLPEFDNTNTLIQYVATFQLAFGD